MKKKITLRQYVLLFIMSNFSPSIRVFATLLSESAGRAAWLVPLAAGVFFILFIFVLSALFKREEYTNLHDTFQNVFGKTLTKLLMGMYLLWIIVLAALYTRYYAERLLSSIIPESSMEFLIIILLTLVYFASRGGIKALARLSEFVFPVFIVILFAMVALLLIDVDVNNLYPITFNDTVPIFGSVHIVLAAWGYFTFNFFFAHEVEGVARIRKHSLHTTLILAVTASMMLVSVIGILGASLTARTGLPFFIAVKGITSLGPFNRLEPVVMSIWIITDFIIISLLSYIGLSISKQVFNLPEKKYLASPFIMIIFILSLFLARNAFELETFSTKVALPVNLVLCYFIPTLTFVMGKIRQIL